MWEVLADGGDLDTLTASLHKFALFLRLDGKDYRPVRWQHARPSADLNVHGTKVTEE